MTPLYKPLYPPEGGKPLAFSCNCPQSGQLCGAVTRTERGIKIHVLRKHGLREQIDLPFNDNPSR